MYFSEVTQTQTNFLKELPRILRTKYLAEYFPVAIWDFKNCYATVTYVKNKIMLMLFRYQTIRHLPVFYVDNT